MKNPKGALPVASLDVGWHSTAGEEFESGKSYTRRYKYVFSYFDSSVADCAKYGTVLGKCGFNCGIRHPYRYVMNMNLYGVERFINGNGEDMAAIHAETMFTNAGGKALLSKCHSTLAT